MRERGRSHSKTEIIPLHLPDICGFWIERRLLQLKSIAPLARSIKNPFFKAGDAP